MTERRAVSSLWYRWKSLKLPWRKRWLCGQDLSGNTFWEFRDGMSTRPRRIAKYPSHTHVGDVHLTPAWLQWLRHTRPAPPSLEEQQLEVHRQTQLKQLVAAADQRWAEKPSFLDSPLQTGQTRPAIAPNDAGVYRGQLGTEAAEAGGGAGDEVSLSNVDTNREGRTGRDDPRTEKKKKDPWSKMGPSEGWQPGEWVPSAAPKR